MLRRVDYEEPPAAALLRAQTAAADPVLPDVSAADLDAGELPHDHPHWVKDAVAVSRAARELLARLRPIVVRVFCVWDHRLRAIVVAGQRIAVDSSGSYRRSG